jgi:hypothetical protein
MDPISYTDETATLAERQTTGRDARAAVGTGRHPGCRGIALAPASRASVD